MTVDRKGIGQALAGLRYHDRAGLTKDALESAVGALSEEDAQRIRYLAARLSDRLKGLGPVSALEVLAAIGMLWSDEGYEP